MKFGEHLIKVMIPEWEEAYINYYILKKIISPFKLMAKLYIKTTFTEGRDQLTITTALPNDMQHLQEFSIMFEAFILGELEKFNAFFQYKLMDVNRKWRIIKINIILIQNMQTQTRLDNHKHELKEAFLTFFKEIQYIKEYVDINNLALKKIMKKHSKTIKEFESTSLSQKFSQRTRDSFISRNFNRIKQLSDQVEDEYLQFFYPGYKKKEGRRSIRRLIDLRMISQEETFMFGLFLGFSIILLFYILLLFATGKLDADDEQLFSEIFPMFRGAALIIVAMWLIGLNVYVWTRYHVNYRHVFKFKYHYSQISEIFKRASFFTTVYLLCFIWYAILKENNEILSPYTKWLPKEYTPFIIWTTLLIYIFFPFKYHWLNYEGRKYFFKLLKNCIFSPFVEMEFRISWLTDQFISLNGALKDLEYTICFYLQTWQRDSVGACQIKNRPTAFIIALIPLSYRMLQCARQGYDNKRFFGTQYMANFFKYFISIMTSILSYISKFDEDYFIPWLILAIISTLYSYLWDLKMDWGFLQPKSKHKFLRDQLCYRNLKFYYYAIILNFGLRIVWVLSISPDIIGGFIRPELFTFVVYFLEAFRRCQWNFFRVEKEHVSNCGDFKAVEDIIFPMTNIEPENLDVLQKHSERVQKQYDFGTDQNYLNISANQTLSNMNKRHDDYQSMHKPNPIAQTEVNIQFQNKYHNQLKSNINKKTRKIAELNTNLNSVKLTRQFFLEKVQKQKRILDQEKLFKKIKVFKDYLMEHGKNKYLIKPSDVNDDQLDDEDNY